MKKQITIIAIACMALFSFTTASAQERKGKQKATSDFRINYIASSDDASTFSVKLSDAQLKDPSLKIYNENGEEIYNNKISQGYKVFKVLSEEPAGTLTFALFDGKKKIASRTWTISSVSETRIIATESR